MSDETKHTPGPWEVIKENRGAIPHQWRPLSIVANADGPDEKIIARLPDGLGPEDFANAALIASAPRLKVERDALLAEIKKYVDAVEDLGLDCPHGILADLPENDVRNLEMAHDSLQAVIAKCGR